MAAAEYKDKFQGLEHSPKRIEKYGQTGKNFGGADLDPTLGQDPQQWDPSSEPSSPKTKEKISVATPLRGQALEGIHEMNSKSKMEKIPSRRVSPSSNDARDQLLFMPSEPGTQDMATKSAMVA